MYRGLFKVYGQSTSFTEFNGYDKGANDVSVCRGSNWLVANSSLQSVIGVDGLSWSLSLQPLPTQVTKFGDSTGGNSLGLHASSGNLVLALLTASWSNAADEAVVAAALTDMYAKANAFAKSKGTLNAFQYTTPTRLSPRLLDTEPIMFGN
ncbi:hypothetical protein O988_00483 [Pseudogymnoascus sp. VKM F-3808]|nr:hypothetical protein O988_00483 [Pseudogymnoascus sp. VKM F-3808]